MHAHACAGLHRGTKPCRVEVLMSASETHASVHQQMAIASAPLSEAPFLVGTAISVWQNSGGEPTNWATWAAKRNILGMSTIKNGDKVLPGSCCSR